MDDLQKSNHPGINYSAFLSIHGKTFIHNLFNSSEDKKHLTDLSSLYIFSKQLLASGLEDKPKVEHWNFIGSSNDIFNS